IIEVEENMATVRKSKKNKIILAVIIVLIIAVLATVIGVFAKNSTIEQVSLYTVGTSDIYETVSATGEISSGSVKEYKVGTVATVKEVFVETGEEVKAGDLLATFDTSNFDSEIKKLQSSYNQAKASYNDALASQKDAKKNLAEIQTNIAELEKENEKLKKDASTTKSTSTTRSSSTQPSLPSNTNPSLTFPPNFPSDLPSNLPTEIPTGNVQIDPDILAGIDINDINAVMSAAASAESKLVSNELMLAAYYVQEQLYSSLASDTLVQAKKEIMDTTKSTLDLLKESQQEMSAGWTAAFDGTITECNIYPGEQTSLLTSGVTLQNMNNKIVTISLGEYDIHKVKVGMPVKVTTAYGEYTGSVISKAPVATGGSSSSIMDSVGSIAGISGLSSLTQSGAGVEVQVSVDNPDEFIVIGFDADVEISVGDHTGITTVPSQSIILDKTGTYVFLYNEEEKTVTKTPIETGATSVSEYEVVSGIGIGDKIVNAPQSTFEDSFEVRVSEQTK
ncbi:MAG: biotin/lipoyl-binding protein, partial [Eubacterium sp.]|nr:biotin/lipoyl-binding protein [Eubacterium sp.]